ncbi:hydroxyacid dehydrogenase [Nonomuraea sp. K274]|uniref:Hydroxyacid dehydrogenase n=1 Tax=Nonomuraea cypriaca TaxID=1187855 RepID=A0A931ALG8_9ACTN|nr:hydroxyacid dehydrogenase [Nonomuraea cypriaca]MBF8193980.1 hydroxyacid dehydrogenase [Nonomuraea cypriaca]
MRPTLPPDLLGPELLARLDTVADVRRDPVHGRWDDPQARALLADATILLTGWGAPRIDTDLLDRAPMLGAVIHAAGSVKGLLAEEVWHRGIAVSSAAQANAVPVVEYTVAAITFAGKRVFRLAHDYRDGRWLGPRDGEDAGNNGITVGVVGASRIGRLVLAALADRDMRLLLADPYVDEETAATLGARLVDIDTLCASSDIVTLHAPALPQTRRLLDDRRLGLIRSGGVVINTARGSLIDTDALTRHCRSGRLDAVLDVTDPEPLPASHPLLSLPNVLLTPHIAGSRGNEVRRLGAYAVAEVERYLTGQPLQGAVSHQDLARIA